jgi:hypothetical protein
MKRLVGLAVALLVLSGSAQAQGVQTGSIRGLVQDPQDRPVPAANISATSPALLEQVSTESDAQGNYTLRALPPGVYEVTVSLNGFTAVRNVIAVPLGLAVEQNVTLRPGGVVETVQVVAQAPPPIATPVIGLNAQHGEVESLANQRHLQGIAQLSPAVTENTPNARQLAINGAFAFDSLFMVNGVDVSDNLLAQPNHLFVEDAIQETQVLTSGISAEYGRFTGGVINAITRSGGNTFGGSFRVNFLNPSWTAETPFEQTQRLDDLQQIYEGTLGGPLVPDRLWFFTAGRYQNTVASNTLPVTGIAYSQPTKNVREEIKVTGAVAPGQTLQAGYLNNGTDLKNNSGALGLLIDPASLDDVRRPNWYTFSNYRGVVGGSLLAEAQYSERRFAFDLGGTSADIRDSVFLSVSQGRQSVYNAPLGNEAEVEHRNNRQFTGSVMGFWEAGGRHESKIGYEFFRSQRKGVGSGALSATDYLFITPYATAGAGTPQLDAAGRLMPVFAPGGTLVQYLPPIARNPVMNTDANSLFLQDHWVIGSHWSADLGVRLERVSAVSTGNIVGARGTRVVPRLAAAYDVTGGGEQVLHATYGQYGGRYNENQFGANGPVGRTATLTSVYSGPAGQGRDFAPGFDMANYALVQATNPTSNVLMDGDLRAPLTHEFTTSYGAQLWQGRGFAEMTYVYRQTTDMIEDFISTATGTSPVVADGIDAGLATNIVYRNTGAANREYQGLVFQSRYRLRDRWTMNGHYTIQLRNHGNYEGEAPNVPGQTSQIGNYPEIFTAERHYPDGRLQNFQRHRLRIWSIYDFTLGQYGDLAVSGLWRVDSSRVYSLMATGQSRTATQTAILTGAGYVDRPANQTLFFGERGSESFKGSGVFDTSINYSVPIVRSLRPWVKFDVYNLFNNQKLIAWNTTVTQDPNSPKDALGLATGYLPGAAFGRASSTANFPAPFGVDENGNAATGGRTFRFAVGFRF